MSKLKSSIAFCLILFLSISYVSAIYRPQKAEAVSGSEWKAGRIIDDTVFTYKGAMSPTQIQEFLNSKVGTNGYDSVPGQCDTNGDRSAQPLASTTRAAYAQSLGKPTKFTCLSNYYEVPKTNPGPGIPANNYGGKAVPSGAKSAAQIIWDAAQRYSISPKVLLVTIQKESAGPLTVDDWPFESQYTYAMGARCPDTAPCDANYAGFSIQIYESARLFRYYLDNMTQPWWTYKKPGINSVLYSPNGSCGSSDVNIETSATAALYTYTPYQPNAAALANLYGTGDGCSAYGNRNFWRIYNDWFDTTYADLFSAAYNTQSANPTLYAGESQTVYLDYRNNGNWDWHDDSINWPGIPPVHLAATQPINRKSMFSYRWPNAGRSNVQFSKVFEADGTTLSTNQHLVKPGQIVRFQFNLTAPWGLKNGKYREYFQPVLEGADGWNIGGVAWFDITIKPRYAAQFVSQSSYPTLTKGQKKPVYISYKNTGADWWYDDTSKPSPSVTPVRVAATNPINRKSGFSFDWDSPGRPTYNFSKVYESNGTTLATNQHIVKPGQIARFDFNMTAPWAITKGTYREYFQPVPEGSSAWQIGGLAWLDVKIQ